jgi:hypothetical protein
MSARSRSGVLLLCAFIGFGHGSILGGIGFLLAGAGHGTFVFIGVFSAPVGLTQNVLVALFSVSTLWAIMALLAASSDRWRVRLIFLCVMSSHYLSLPAILSAPSKFADWTYMKKLSPAAIGVAFGIYGAGELALWTLFLFQVFRGRQRVHNGPGVGPAMEEEA